MNTEQLIEIFTDAATDLLKSVKGLMDEIDDDIETLENMRLNHAILIQHIRDLRLVYFCQTGRFPE